MRLTRQAVVSGPPAEPDVLLLRLVVGQLSVDAIGPPRQMTAPTSLTAPDIRAHAASNCRATILIPHLGGKSPVPHSGQVAPPAQKRSRLSIWLRLGLLTSSSQANNSSMMLSASFINLPLASVRFFFIFTPLPPLSHLPPLNRNVPLGSTLKELRGIQIGAAATKKGPFSAKNDSFGPYDTRGGLVSGALWLDCQLRGRLEQARLAGGHGGRRSTTTLPAPELIGQTQSHGWGLCLRSNSLLPPGLRQSLMG